MAWKPNSESRLSSKCSLSAFEGTRIAERSGRYTQTSPRSLFSAGEPTVDSTWSLVMPSSRFSEYSFTVENL